MSGVKGDNSLKIFGPDIDQLELLANKAKHTLEGIRGVASVGVFHVRGATHLQFRVDPLKCQKWGVTTADVNNVVTTAMAAQPQSTMVEGEKLFNISIRWPKWRRNDETSILDIPVDIINNQVVLPSGSGLRPSATGHALPPPAVGGFLGDTSNPISQHPATAAAQPGHAGGQEPRPGTGRLVHRLGRRHDLSRERPSHDRHQVQRTRPRPGQCRGRGQEKDGRALPRSLHRGLERRIRADGGSQRPAVVDHPAVAGADLHPAVRGISLVPGHDRDLQQRLRRGSRGHLVALPDGYELQRLGHRRLRVALRHCHHGGLAPDLVLQRPACPGADAATTPSSKARSSECGR